MMNDVLVFGNEEHDRRLEQVLRRLEELGMTLNKGKWEFRVREVTFLGHKVSGQGISPDPEKMKATTEMRAPGNQSELKNFYRWSTT